jgi:copper(I)-binding protein
MTIRPMLFAALASFSLTAALPVWAHGPAAPAPEAATTAAPVAVGSLEITSAYTRATLPNAPVGGGYLTITNNGTEADRLLSGSVDFAAELQVHEMALVDNVMKMRQLGDGLDIPAGQSVELKPGGFHLMFMKLNTPLVEGTSVPVTLTFEKAGTVTLDFLVAAPAAKSAPAAEGHK